MSSAQRVRLSRKRHHGQISCQLRATAKSETVRFTLHRLHQEFLNNICKHACVSEITISLRQQGNVLHLEVQDNGVGILADKGARFGIQAMRERVRALVCDSTLEPQEELLTYPQICNKLAYNQEKVLVTADFLSSSFSFTFL